MKICSATSEAKVPAIGPARPIASLTLGVGRAAVLLVLLPRTRIFGAVLLLAGAALLARVASTTGLEDRAAVQRQARDVAILQTRGVQDDGRLPSASVQRRTAATSPRPK